MMYIMLYELAILKQNGYSFSVAQACYFLLFLLASLLRDQSNTRKHLQSCAFPFTTMPSYPPLCSPFHLYALFSIPTPSFPTLYTSFLPCTLLLYRKHSLPFAAIVQCLASMFVITVVYQPVNLGFCSLQFFGFVATAALFVDLFFQFKLWRAQGITTSHTTTTTHTTTTESRY